ncbi:MAG TPA: hypothetical protein VH277_09250 [Gemmatimonadaceae bacterium]|jgi:hypothetical protein|nr:hypothetical protein [Gemmatimonadaceae bacterium]
MIKLISRDATAALFALFALFALLRAPTASSQQPFDSSAWDIHAAEWRVEPYRGRGALFLRDGAAWLKGSRFQNGTIDFDVVFDKVGGFPGIAFRAATRSDFELFYLRQELSGGPHATQYTPVLHGLYAWQIYAGPKWESTAHWTYDRWMHVKLLVRGSRSELFVDGDSAVQVVGQMRGPNGPGEVGLLSGTGARFANVVVRPAGAAEETTTTPQGAAVQTDDSTPPTVVRSWRVSAPFAESTLDKLTDLATLPGGAWTMLGVEERGIANLARLAGNGDGRNTVVAAVTLTSDRDRIVRLRFGYSDRVHVFLNGRLLYAGNSGFGTRDPEFLGIVGLFDQLALPLTRGPNQLWFAVSETFGGWAVTADLPDHAGITVAP